MDEREFDNRILTKFETEVIDTLSGEANNLVEIPSVSWIAKDGELLAEATNMVELSNDSSQHSEILAVSKAKDASGQRYLTNCILITTLEPCLLCTGHILLSRLSEVYYFLPAKPGEGISSLSLELIYHRNFFPKLHLRYNSRVLHLFQGFFEARR